MSFRVCFQFAKCGQAGTIGFRSFIARAIRDIKQGRPAVRVAPSIRWIARPTEIICIGRTFPPHGVPLYIRPPTVNNLLEPMDDAGADGPTFPVLPLLRL